MYLYASVLAYVDICVPAVWTKIFPQGKCWRRHFLVLVVCKPVQPQDKKVNDLLPSMIPSLGVSYLCPPVSVPPRLLWQAWGLPTGKGVRVRSPMSIRERSWRHGAQANPFTRVLMPSPHHKNTTPEVSQESKIQFFKKHKHLSGRFGILHKFHFGYLLWRIALFFFSWLLFKGGSFHWQTMGIIYEIKIAYCPGKAKHH